MFKKLFLLIGIIFAFTGTCFASTNVHAKGSNWGVNAGVGVGSGESSDKRSGNAGFNVGKSNSDSMWVNDQTSLTGGKVEINVDGKTTVTGGIIAALDKDGTDNGQLNLATGEFEYRDLQDFSNSSDSGFGFSTSVGGSADKGIASARPQGSTTISMKDTGSETEQTTHATIGGGNITVGGTVLGDDAPALAGLNRDVDNAQEITRDMITGSLDNSVTIDNRIITSSGRAEIINQHENLDKNLIIAGVGAYGTVEGAVKFVGDATGINGPEYDKNGNKVETSAIDKWKANQSGMATGIRRGGDDGAQAIIKDIANGETLSPEDFQKLAGMTSDGSINLVFSDATDQVMFINPDGEILEVVSRKGFNDLQNQQGYVNLATGAGTDAHTFLRTDAEERAHNYVGKSETAAKSAAENEMSYYNTVAGLTGGYTLSDPGQIYKAINGFTTKQNEYNQIYNGNTNDLLNKNNASAGQVREEDKSNVSYQAVGVIGSVGLGGARFLGTGAIQAGNNLSEAASAGAYAYGEMNPESPLGAFVEFKNIKDGVYAYDQENPDDFDKLQKTVEHLNEYEKNKLTYAEASAIFDEKLPGYSMAEAAAAALATSGMSVAATGTIIVVDTTTDGAISDAVNDFKQLPGGAVILDVANMIPPAKITPKAPGAGQIDDAATAAAKAIDKIDDATSALNKLDDVATSATAPIGRKGNPLDVAPGTNKPATINNQPYSGHALDQMQSDGIMPSVVQNALDNVKPTAGNQPGTLVYYDSVNNISVVKNADTNNVITVSRGHLKEGN